MIRPDPLLRGGPSSPLANFDCRHTIDGECLEHGARGHLAARAVTLAMRAGVVDEQIQASVARVHEIRQAPDAATVLHIQRVEHHAQPLGAQKIRGHATERGSPRRQHHLDIPPRQLPHDLHAQAAVGTCHNRDLRKMGGHRSMGGRLEAVGVEPANQAIADQQVRGEIFV